MKAFLAVVPPFVTVRIATALRSWAVVTVACEIASVIDEFLSSALFLKREI